MSGLLSFFDSSIYPVLAEKVPLRFSVAGSIFAMLCIVYGSKYVQAILSLVLTQKYDNVQASYRYGKKLDGTLRTWQEKMVERAYSAHQNQWEAFTAFSVAALVAILKAPESLLNKEILILTNAFLLIRVIYNFVYVIAFNTPLSLIRSSVWMVGGLIVVKIFLLSIGNVYHH